MQTPPPLLWAGVDVQAIPEIQRQAELFLANTLTVAIGADQRATTLTAVYGGAGVALLGATGTVIATDKPAWALVAAFLAAALAMLVASLICAYASRPIDFYLSGYEPRLLIPGAGDASLMPRYICEACQESITKNRKALESAAGIVSSGNRMAFDAILAGVVAYIAAALWPAVLLPTLTNFFHRLW